MNTEEWTTSLAIRAAWMSFIGRSTQGEIAKQLGISPAKVHRLISHAQREGLVKFYVEERPSECLRLEQKLSRTLNLSNCFIAPDLGHATLVDPFAAVASFAGQFLHRLLSDSSIKRIGVGMGRTLRQMVDNMPRIQRDDLDIVSISGSLTRSLSANPYDVVRPLQEATGGTGFYLPVPYLAETKEERDTFLSQRSVQELMQRARSAELFIVGIGSVSKEGHLVKRALVDTTEQDELRESTAISDFVSRFVDINGKEVPLSLNDKAVGIHFEDMRGSRVVAVAGGQEKAEAVLGAVNAGVITDLVIDEPLARKITSLITARELEGAS